MSFYLFYYKRKQKSRQHRQFFINFLVFPPRTIYNCFNMRAQSAWTRRKKESAALSALSFQRVKKVCDFFARFKKRHIFCENKFSRKISLRSSKSPYRTFLMAIIKLEAGLFSLRLGHGAALTCHRHVIHYRAAASLPKRGAEGVRGCLCAHLKPLSRSAAHSRGSPQRAHWGKGSPELSLEQSAKDRAT